MDKFKTFLAGSPYRKAPDQIEVLAHLVAAILPSVLKEWYDSEFGGDVWAKDGAYYETARTKLSALGAFKKNCADSGAVLQALKLLVAFLAEEKRKAGLGKTTHKTVVAGSPPGGQGDGPADGAAGSGVPGDPPEDPTLEEGAVKNAYVTKHERNPALRKACIAHWRSQHGGKITCAACGMSFGERYGVIGEGYIEVHHLSPISQTGDVHAVDPKADLVPLCANCHAMIHRVMSVAEKKGNVKLEGPAALAELKKRLVV